MEDCYNCITKHKYSIIGKGSILVSALSSIFTLLDVYSGGSYIYWKYITIGLLNIAIAFSGYIFSQLEMKLLILDEENSSLKYNNNELRRKTMAEYQFPVDTPVSDISTNLEMVDFNELYTNVRTTHPTEPTVSFTETRDA